jgi:hypothetical protein
MDDGQKKVVVKAKASFYSADDERSVGVSDLLDNQSDGVGAPLAQRSGKEIRTVVELQGGSLDALLGMLWNDVRGRGIVEDGRNRAGRQAYTISNILQRDSTGLTEQARLFLFLPFRAITADGS